MTNDGVELMTRWLLGFAGLGVYVHYFLMANFLRSAPHLVRAICLPTAAGGAAGMIVCAITDNMLGAAQSSSVAVSGVVCVSLAAFNQGLSMSDVFDRAASAHWQRTNQIMARIRAYTDGIEFPVDSMGRPIVTERGLAEYEASRRRAQKEGRQA